MQFPNGFYNNSPSHAYDVNRTFHSSNVHCYTKPSTLNDDPPQYTEAQLAKIKELEQDQEDIYPHDAVLEGYQVLNITHETKSSPNPFHMLPQDFRKIQDDLLKSPIPFQFSTRTLMSKPETYSFPVQLQSFLLFIKKAREHLFTPIQEFIWDGSEFVKTIGSQRMKDALKKQTPPLHNLIDKVDGSHIDNHKSDKDIKVYACDAKPLDPEGAIKETNWDEIIVEDIIYHHQAALKFKVVFKDNSCADLPDPVRFEDVILYLKKKENRSSNNGKVITSIEITNPEIIPWMKGYSLNGLVLNTLYEAVDKMNLPAEKPKELDYPFAEQIIELASKHLFSYRFKNYETLRTHICSQAFIIADHTTEGDESGELARKSHHYLLPGQIDLTIFEKMKKSQQRIVAEGMSMKFHVCEGPLPDPEIRATLPAISDSLLNVYRPVEVKDANQTVFGFYCVHGAKGGRSVDPKAKYSLKDSAIKYCKARQVDSLLKQFIILLENRIKKSLSERQSKMDPALAFAFIFNACSLLENDFSDEEILTIWNKLSIHCTPAPCKPIELMLEALRKIKTMTHKTLYSLLHILAFQYLMSAKEVKANAGFKAVLTFHGKDPAIHLWIGGHSLLFPVDPSASYKAFAIAYAKIEKSADRIFESFGLNNFFTANPYSSLLPKKDALDYNSLIVYAVAYIEKSLPLLVKQGYSLLLNCWTLHHAEDLKIKLWHYLPAILAHEKDPAARQCILEKIQEHLPDPYPDSFNTYLSSLKDHPCDREVYDRTLVEALAGSHLANAFTYVQTYLRDDGSTSYIKALGEASLKDSNLDRHIRYFSSLCKLIRTPMESDPSKKMTLEGLVHRWTANLLKRNKAVEALNLATIAAHEKLLSSSPLVRALTHYQSADPQVKESELELITEAYRLETDPSLLKIYKALFIRILRKGHSSHTLADDAIHRRCVQWIRHEKTLGAAKYLIENCLSSGLLSSNRNCTNIWIYWCQTILKEKGALRALEAWYEGTGSKFWYEPAIHDKDRKSFLSDFVEKLYMSENLDAFECADGLVKYIASYQDAIVNLKLEALAKNQKQLKTIKSLIQSCSLERAKNTIDQLLALINLDKKNEIDLVQPFVKIWLLKLCGPEWDKQGLNQAQELLKNPLMKRLYQGNEQDYISLCCASTEMAMGSYQNDRRCVLNLMEISLQAAFNDEGIIFHLKESAEAAALLVKILEKHETIPLSNSQNDLIEKKQETLLYSLYSQGHKELILDLFIRLANHQIPRFPPSKHLVLKAITKSLNDLGKSGAKITETSLRAPNFTLSESSSASGEQGRRRILNVALRGKIKAVLDQFSLYRSDWSMDQLTECGEIIEALIKHNELEDAIKWFDLTSQSMIDLNHRVKETNELFTQLSKKVLACILPQLRTKESFLLAAELLKAAKYSNCDLWNKYLESIAANALKNDLRTLKKKAWEYVKIHVQLTQPRDLAGCQLNNSLLDMAKDSYFKSLNSAAALEASEFCSNLINQPIALNPNKQKHLYEFLKSFLEHLEKHKNIIIESQLLLKTLFNAHVQAKGYLQTHEAEKQVDFEYRFIRKLAPFATDIENLENFYKLSSLHAAGKMIDDNRLLELSELYQEAPISVFFTEDEGMRHLAQEAWDYIKEIENNHFRSISNAKNISTLTKLTSFELEGMVALIDQNLKEIRIGNGATECFFTVSSEKIIQSFFYAMLTYLTEYCDIHINEQIFSFKPADMLQKFLYLAHKTIEKCTPFKIIGNPEKDRSVPKQIKFIEDLLALNPVDHPVRAMLICYAWVRLKELMVANPDEHEKYLPLIEKFTFSKLPHFFEFGYMHIQLSGMLLFLFAAQVNKSKKPFLSYAEGNLHIKLTLFLDNTLVQNQEYNPQIKQIAKNLINDLLDLEDNYRAARTANILLAHQEFIFDNDVKGVEEKLKTFDRMAEKLQFLSMDSWQAIKLIIDFGETAATFLNKIQKLSKTAITTRDNLCKQVVQLYQSALKSCPSHEEDDSKDYDLYPSALTCICTFNSHGWLTEQDYNSVLQDLAPLAHSWFNRHMAIAAKLPKNSWAYAKALRDWSIKLHKIYRVLKSIKKPEWKKVTIELWSQTHDKFLSLAKHKLQPTTDQVYFSPLKLGLDALKYRVEIDTFALKYDVFLQILTQWMKLSIPQDGDLLFLKINVIHKVFLLLTHQHGDSIPKNTQEKDQRLRLFLAWVKTLEKYQDAHINTLIKIFLTTPEYLKTLFDNSEDLTSLINYFGKTVISDQIYNEVINAIAEEKDNHIFIKNDLSKTK